MKGALACLLACALAWTCPGLAAYAAAGEMAAPGAAASAKGMPVLALPAIAPSAPTLPALSVEGLDAGVLALQSSVTPSAVAPEAAPVRGAEQALVSGTRQLANARGDSERQGALAKIFTGGQAAAQSFDAAQIPAGELAASGLTPSESLRTRGDQPPPTPPSARGPNAPSPRGPRGSKFIGFLTAFGRVAAAGAAVKGLQILAASAFPAVFGLAPMAAVWPLIAGAPLLLGAVYSRYLLSRHDLPRLRKTKWVMDLAIGGALGAAAVAWPALAAIHALPFAGPLLAVAGAGSLLSIVGGGRMLDVTLGAGTMAALPMVLHAARAGVIGVAPLLGLTAIPVITTIAFFLGSIVKSAQTGDEFSVPGTLQKLRFPSFHWVMMGVVFALLSGFAPVHPNIAFGVWTALGMLGNRAPKDAGKGDGKKPAKTPARFLAKALNFDLLYLGLLAFTAATGFASPLTFLVLTFAPERAAVWTERLLGRFLPKGDPAPPTTSKPVFDAAAWAQGVERRAPNFHFWLRTAVLILTVAAFGYGMGALVYGMGSYVKNLAIGLAMAAVPYFFSDKLVVLMMKAKPTDEAHDPELFGIMKELRARINEERAAKGRKPIPMPDMVNVPMAAPNAFATGRDPFHAVVGATEGIKQMLLSPESLRQQLVTLMSGVDPSGKSYRIFRRAIAGSIGGVTEGSTPQEISQALMRAAPGELKALGVRLLRGVLGHEFSHVVDRHMLTGSIAGGISTGVAFSSYGAMWGLAHVQKAAASLKRMILGGPSAPPAPSESAAGPGAADGQSRSVKPEVVEPVSAAILGLKGITLILKLSALLWGPLIAQVTQMAGSRNNESQADHDGAYLTGDPEALALSLGLLMAWKPQQGFLFGLSRLPGLAAAAHLFTVNPLGQLEQAQALPKPEGFSRGVVGRRENWMANLLTTHPDTTSRIEALDDLSQAMGHVRRPPSPPSPPRGGGGNLSPPLAFAPIDPAGLAPTAPGRGGLLSVRRWLRVLPDEERNREFWKFTWGQALLTLGLNFHYAALPGLVAPNKKDAGKLGVNRAANWAAQAGSSLFTGPIVDRASVRKTIFWTHLGRGLLMMAVPLLFFHGYLVFGSFLLVIAVHGFVQSTSITAGSVAFNRILGPDDAYYNRANAVFNVIMNAVGVVAPLLAGTFIGHFDAKLGLLAGNALAYAVYGAALLAVSVFYGLFLRVPRDEAQQARLDLADALKGLDVVKGVRVVRHGAKVALQVEVAGDFVNDGRIPPSFGGFPVVVAPLTSPWRELAQGFRLIWRSKFLRRFQLLSTLGSVAGDALVFTALPRYIHDVLGRGSMAASGLFSQSGAFGLYLAASALGLGISSGALMAAQNKAPSQLSVVAADFGRSLAQAPQPSPEEKIEAAMEAIRQSPDAVLERYVKIWRSDAKAAIPLDRFQSDLRAEVAQGLDKALFGETERLLEASGLGAALDAWSQRHFDKLSRSARRQARTGLDEMERQGRWSAWLQGLGWLAYWGVFLSCGLASSVTAMFAALLLQGPAQIIWASLLQRVLREETPNDMGKVYSSIFFYDLLCSMAGVLLFGSLMTAFSTMAALRVLCAFAGATGLLSFLQPRLVFSGRKKGARR